MDLCQKFTQKYLILPECSEGFLLLFRGLGVEVCSLEAAFPCAIASNGTVRNEGHMAVPLAGAAIL